MSIVTLGPRCAKRGRRSTPKAFGVGLGSLPRPGIGVEWNCVRKIVAGNYWQPVLPRIWFILERYDSCLRAPIFFEEMKNIHVSIRDQRLTLKDNEMPIRTYPVSTSRFGVGTEQGSMKTPTGRFCVGEKIGGEMPGGTIFRSRVPLKPDDSLPPTEDLVMSRILWLDGLDEHNANTRDRFIYIHGTKHEDRVGTPASCGCVRMRNADVIELFDLVDEGTPIVIEA